MVRQRSAKPSSAGSIPAVASNIPLPDNFSFPATVVSHGWYRLAPFRWEQGVLSRKERVGEVTGELVVRAKDGVLRWEFRVPRSENAPATHNPQLTTLLTARITRMLQLHLDLTEFHERTRSSPAHEWVAREGFGRLLCGTTLWEDAVKIIATTNTMWSQTVRMVELLVGKCGVDGAFPTQEDILRFDPDELQRDCRLGYRAKSIHALASYDLSSIDTTQPTEALFKSYQKLPGIGPYGAAHLLAMDGRHDFIAVDTEFRRFVRETYHGGRKVSDAAMLRRYSKWGRWKYLAFWSEMWGSR